jgi:hypothetical protein
MTLPCLLAAVVLAGTRTTPVLNEIYYDAPGIDDDREYVEIFNPAPETLRLEDFRLESLNSRGEWILLYDGGPYDRVPPGGVFLVGGDELPVSPQDNLYAALPNSKGSIRLVDLRGEVVDLVGYGEDAAAYEGAPLPDVEAGRSLSRDPDGADTDDNARDLRDDLPPSPGFLNRPARDLALVGSQDAWGLEPGEGFVPARIENRGAANPGEARVTWTWTSDGEERARGETRVASPEPGATEQIRVPPSGLVRGVYDLRLQVTLADDQNPLNDSWRGTVRIGKPGLVVTEILYRPSSEGGEWVEVFNLDDDSLDLTGWSIADARSDPALIESRRLVLPAGRFLVFCQDSLAFRRLHGPTARVQEPRGTWPDLNDTETGGEADRVRILDAYGIPVEDVGYPALLGSARGVSLERPFPPGGRDAKPRWFPSSHPAGSTPGGYNSQRAERLVPDRVTIRPNPFVPARGSCRIGFFLEPDFATWSLDLFDLGGRRLRRFEEPGMGGGWKEVTWDGRDALGRQAPGGIYLAAVVRRAEGRRVTSKHVIVLVEEGR